MQDETLKSRLFELSDLLGWFISEGYDVNEIGADNFAVTANHSRFYQGKMYHVAPGQGVLESVER